MCVLQVIHCSINVGAFLLLFVHNQKLLVTWLSIHLGIKINEALPCSMEVWKIVPTCKALSFNQGKQLLDEERTMKQQTYPS